MSPSCQSNGLGSGHASPEEMSCLADGIAIGSPLPLGIYHSKDESISPDDIASSMDATDGSLKSSDSDSGRDSAIDDLPRASGLSMDGLASDTLRSSCCNLLGSYCNHSDRDSAISESPLSIGITMSGVQSRSSMQLDAASPDCNQSPCAEPISMTKDLISALPHVVVSPKKIKSPERQNKRKISADLFPPAHNIIGNSTVFRRKLDFSSVQLNQPPKKASQVNAVVFWQAQPRREDSGPRTLMCCAQNTNSPCQSPTMLSEDNMMQQATTSRSLSS
jgi:hypothetical protein